MSGLSHIFKSLKLGYLVDRRRRHGYLVDRRRVYLVDRRHGYLLDLKVDIW